MGNSNSAGWRLCKCSVIFEDTNELVQNDFLHATQYDCIYSDPTTKPYSKRFSNRGEWSIIWGANSRETPNLQMPSRVYTGLLKKWHWFWTTAFWLAATPTNRAIRNISSSKTRTLLVSPTFGFCLYLSSSILHLAAPNCVTQQMICVIEIIFDRLIDKKAYMSQVPTTVRVLHRLGR